MNAHEAVTLILLVLGCLFFTAGTVGLLRFPDTLCRIHALTKADNLGLFFLCCALALLSGQLRVIAVLGLIWMLNLLAATVSAHLIARYALADADSRAPDGANPPVSKEPGA